MTTRVRALFHLLEYSTMIVPLVMPARARLLWLPDNSRFLKLPTDPS